MGSASRALQAAIQDVLSRDEGLRAALGGARIYDYVPRKVDFPYMTFGEISVRNWSTGTDLGEEHSITFHIWSRAAGRGEVHDIASAVRAALHDRQLIIPGHRLINLQHEYSESGRENDGEHFKGLVRFRAVTEPLG